MSSQRRYAEATALAQSSYERLESSVGPRARGRLADQAASTLGQNVDYTRSLAWSEITLTCDAAAGDDELLASGLGSRSFALFQLGRQREAVIVARGMASLAAESGALREQAAALMGLSLYALGDNVRESIAAARESAALARRAGLRGMEMTNMLNIAEQSLAVGDLGAGRAILDDIGARPGLDPEVLAWIETIGAVHSAVRGDVPAALGAIEATPMREATEFLSGETTFLYVSAIIYLVAGEPERARENARAAVRKDPMGINAPVSLLQWMRAALWLRDADDLREGLAAAALLPGRYVAAIARSFEPGLAALEGRLDEAAAGYAAAFELWRELDNPLELALTELDCVVALGPDHPSAVAAKESADLLVELGALGYLARLEATRATAG
jgi:tetratricopeptide (TPR) repeat protein